MRFFACAIQAHDSPKFDWLRKAVECAPYCHGHPLRWYATDGIVAVIGPEHGACPPRYCRAGSAVVVGVARLDNRADIIRWLRPTTMFESDLGLVMRMVHQTGLNGIGRLHGDFAFVYWDSSKRLLVAACDVFGVKKLYFATPRTGYLAFASRAELLASGSTFDIQYLAERLAYSVPAATRTVYATVRALPAASILTLCHDAPVISEYWSPLQARCNGGSLGSESDQCEAFRDLLAEAVRSRLSSDGTTWSHLSGGLDSSSVVSVAQWLARSGAAPQGLAGSVTFIDPLGTAADEKEYSDAVVRHWEIRNELVSHQFSWREIATDPPVLDQPGTSSYSIAARDLHAVNLVQRAGGTVLLTGVGGDSLVMGTMFFFADWLAAGLVSQAVTEMMRRAAIGRVSFWELAYKNGLLPLLPGQLRRALASRQHSFMPDWLSKTAVRRFDLKARHSSDRVYDGRLGRKYADAQAATIAAIPSIMDDGISESLLDVRHPFLYRPLVELALRLAPEMCVRPHARKWILREAMRGVLPEVVRTRVGKGLGSGLSSRALVQEQGLIERLLRDPILAELGVIDPKRTMEALALEQSSWDGGSSVSPMLQNTLDVEIWLRVRSGRWAAEVSQDHGISSVAR